MLQSEQTDALTDVLQTIRLSAQTYFCTDFNSPWGMDIAHSAKGMFHIVVEGRCWLKVANQEHKVELKPGDIVAFPTGGEHWLGDNAETPRLPGGDVVSQVLSGENPFPRARNDAGPAESIRLLCGAFEYDSAIDHPFLKGLPCFIHIEANSFDKKSWLHALIETLSRETRISAPGSSVVVDRLTEILFVELMRAHMNNSENSLAYMRALNDPQVGKVLNHIHADKQAHWTVERLADNIGLSRTAFTEKFTRLVTMSPKSYLLNWRMQKAKSLLQNTSNTMIDIAEMSGYSSEAAFSKAFKQFFGTPPGKFRRSEKVKIA